MPVAWNVFEMNQQHFDKVWQKYFEIYNRNVFYLNIQIPKYLWIGSVMRPYKDVKVYRTFFAIENDKFI